MSTSNSRCTNRFRKGVGIRVVAPRSESRFPAAMIAQPSRESVFAQLSIEDQLVATGLYHARRRIQFVQEEDSRSVLGQKLRRRPFRPPVAS